MGATPPSFNSSSLLGVNESSPVDEFRPPRWTGRPGHNIDDFFGTPPWDRLPLAWEFELGVTIQEKIYNQEEATKDLADWKEAVNSVIET